jgi:hypothetical protein
VLDNVRPPSVESTVSTLTLISRILGVAKPKEKSPLVFIKALSAVLSLVTYLVNRSGQSTLPDTIRARTGELAKVLARDLTATADTFGAIGRLIASDNGTLERFQSLVKYSPEWDLGPSSVPAREGIAKAAQQWFATQLAPVAFPWLVIGWGATANNLSCYYIKYHKFPVRYDVKPWRNEPILAQTRTVVAFQDGLPVSQSVFFGGAYQQDVPTTNPSDSLADYLFGSRTGQVGLNLGSFLSQASFGAPHRITNGQHCP